jgi:hypothetical protein
MSGANDWTIEIETKGLPELKKLYSLLGAPENVTARCFKQFGHNYNQVSRELMYNLFNKHLHLGQAEPVFEKPFVPVPPAQLSVFDEQHPLPIDAVDARGLRDYLTRESDSRLKKLFPKDARTLAELREVIAPALRVMIGDQPGQRERPASKTQKHQTQSEQISFVKLNAAAPGSGEHVPAILVSSVRPEQSIVVWVHPHALGSLKNERGELCSPARQIIDGGASILAVEALHTGGTAAVPVMPVNSTYAGYTFGYNRPLLANRVRDILSAIALARNLSRSGQVDLIGWDKAGPWTLLARALSARTVRRTAIDFNGFRFDSVTRMTDEMMLPGALKYGGLPVLATLAAPEELHVYNARNAGSNSWLRAAYTAAGRPDNLYWCDETKSPEEVVRWMLRPPQKGQN